MTAPWLHDLARWSLVDVLVLLAVSLAVVGALRRRAGLLGALGAGLGALVVAWLVGVSVATWASLPLADLAASSHLLHVVPVPTQALHQAGGLWDRLVHRP